MPLKADLDATLNVTWAAVEAPNPLWSIKAMSRKMGKPEHFWRAGNHITFDKLYMVFAPWLWHIVSVYCLATNLPWRNQEIWPEVTQGLLFELWEGCMCLKLPLVSIKKPAEMNFLIERMWRGHFWSDDVATCVPNTLHKGEYTVRLQSLIVRVHWNNQKPTMDTVFWPAIISGLSESLGRKGRQIWDVSAESIQNGFSREPLSWTQRLGKKYLSLHLATHFNLPNN